MTPGAERLLGPRGVCANWITARNVPQDDMKVPMPIALTVRKRRTRCQAPWSLCAGSKSGSSGVPAALESSDVKRSGGPFRSSSATVRWPIVHARPDPVRRLGANRDVTRSGTGDEAEHLPEPGFSARGHGQRACALDAPDPMQREAAALDGGAQRARQVQTALAPVHAGAAQGAPRRGRGREVDAEVEQERGARPRHQAAVWRG